MILKNQRRAQRERLISDLKSRAHLQLTCISKLQRIPLVDRVRMKFKVQDLDYTQVMDL
jgi:hypothetical protein